MGLAQELQQIAQLQLLNDNVDDLETANANIYLDSGDINVAQTTLEMLIGGQASVLNTENPHYKANYIWGTNELLTSIKTSLGTIDDTIDTTPGQEKLKVDIVSATATLDVKNGVGHLTVSTNKDSFGPQPFLAIKTTDKRYLTDNFDLATPRRRWHYTFDSQTVPLKAVETIGIATNAADGSTCVVLKDNLHG